jgi:hypothetical protein
VQAIAYYNGQVISGGHYGKIDGTLIGLLTALNSVNGTIDTSWFPNPDEGLDRGVWVIYADEKLHVGGAFRKMGTLKVRGYSQFSPIP